jgi:protein SCO1/2
MAGFNALHLFKTPSRLRSKVRYREAQARFDANRMAIKKVSVNDFQAQLAPAGLHREVNMPGARLYRRGLGTALLEPLVGALALVAAAMIGPAFPTAFADDAPDPHARHHMVPETTRSTADYVVPDVKLVREDGKTVLLNQELNDGRPVVLNFIYTTCTSVCPLTSQTFSELQSKLGTRRDTVHLMSISIDPEQDTPARLREYARKFGAGPEWQHYTGTLAASTATQRAFNVYRGDKMSHAPATLLRAAPGKRWVRIDGLVTADELLGELRQAVASR